MNQALHILRKDLRYLRNEIGLLVVLAATYTWMMTGAMAQDWGENSSLFSATGQFTLFFIVLCATMLIGLSVQAEAIPGDRQFWITRPYRWSQLLTAKVLFTLLAVNLPIFIGRLAIAVIDGIPVLAALPALISSQVWLFFVIAIPTAVIASVTPGLVSFIFAVAAIWFVSATGLSLFHELSRWPTSLDWVRELLCAIVLIVISSSILYIEYRRRRTLLVRTIGICAVAVIMFLYRYVPLTFALDAQNRISPQPEAARPVDVAVTPKFVNIRINNTDRDPVVNFDVDVLGLPDGYAARGDLMAVELQGADGRIWTSGLIGMTSPPDLSNHHRAMAFVDPDFVRLEHDKPLTLAATTYLTMYGNPRTRELRLDPGTKSTVTDDLVCSEGHRGDFSQLRCLWVSLMSKSLVLVKDESGTRLLAPNIYMPYPAGVVFEPTIESSTWSKRDTFTLITMDLLGHLKRDYRATGIRLDDLH